MRQVTSPACPAPANRGGRPWGRALAVAAAMALTAGLVVAPAAAEDLTTRQQQVRGDAQAVRSELDADEAALGAASRALVESQARLTDAEVRLADTQVRLAAARESDAALAVRLREERAQLARDEASVALAQGKVDEQQALIVQAARDSFQQQADLGGLGVVFGPEGTESLARRSQWYSSVFDTTQARLDTLNVLRAQLQQARDRQDATAALVAADKDEAARTVRQIDSLARQAEALRGDVASLVAENEANRQAAQAELDSDRARYDELMAEDAKISQELMARAAAQLRAGVRYVTSVPAGQVWTDPATYPLLARGPQVAVSRQGFIRPVAAAPGSAFGLRFHPILRTWRLHGGTDYGAACGTPLYAAQAGRVEQARSQGGFGNYTIIDHGVVDGRSVMTGYAHQSQMAVSAGEFVAQGQLIGRVGTTGLSTGCHLHLQVYVDGAVANPLSWTP